MITQNLAQLTQQIRDHYSGLRTDTYFAEKISLNDDGLLQVNQNEYPVKAEAAEQFWCVLHIPKDFMKRVPSDIRSRIFNHFFHQALTKREIPNEIRLIFDNNDHVIGYDDPSLHTIDPITLCETVNNLLPNGLLAEEIDVSRLTLKPDLISFSCYTPQIMIQPRKGDIINGGIDINHSITGSSATQVRCYLRRLVCENGATTHVCNDSNIVRSRRLSNKDFTQADMHGQIYRLISEAWKQLETKLAGITNLLSIERVHSDYIKQLRTKYSLNNNMLKAFNKAIDEDELGTTNTQYDWFNAISRIATHVDTLSMRQQRTLMSMAGEFSQQHVHKCDQCGSWVIEES